MTAAIPINQAGAGLDPAADQIIVGNWLHTGDLQFGSDVLTIENVSAERAWIHNAGSPVEWIAKELLFGDSFGDEFRFRETAPGSSVAGLYAQDDSTFASVHVGVSKHAACEPLQNASSKLGSISNKWGMAYFGSRVYFGSASATRAYLQEGGSNTINLRNVAGGAGILDVGTVQVTTIVLDGKTVSEGDADSGGPGKRALVVDN